MLARLRLGQGAISVFMAVEDYEPFKEKMARRTRVLTAQMGKQPN